MLVFNAANSSLSADISVLKVAISLSISNADNSSFNVDTSVFNVETSVCSARMIFHNSCPLAGGIESSVVDSPQEWLIATPTKKRRNNGD